MANQKKIINELQFQLNSNEVKNQHYPVQLSVSDAEKIISLLRIQEAKPMTEYDDGWDCPRCGIKLIGKTASGYPYDMLDLPNDEIMKYCPVCGQAVKWG